MSKFKVGDEVECVDNKNCNFMTLGKKYKIVEFDKSGDPGIINDNNFVGYYLTGRFKKVTEEPKFKAGSKAWSPSYGWGQVKESKDTRFPIYVTFRNMGMVYYTAEGKTFETSPLPTLFLSEVSASDWPNPPAKVDPSTFVVDQDLEVKLSSHGVWILTKFAMLKNGEVWVFSNSEDSKSAEIMYKTEDFRLPIAQKGV